MPAASACAVSSPVVASGTCRPPPTTCASYTGSLFAAPDQPQRGTPPTTGLGSKPLEARQGRLPAMLEPLQTTTPGFATECWPRRAAGFWPTCRPSTYGLPDDPGGL